MKRLCVLSAAIVFAVSCGSSSSSSAPSATPTTKPTLVATLSPGNEIPPISGPESTGSGTVAVVWDTTTDSAGNITTAKVNFSVSLTGFPPGISINVAHIHQGASTCASCGVVVSTTLSAADQLKSDSVGAVTFAKNGISVDAALAQQIIANPSGFYFNVHSQSNPGGVARGQLSRAQ
ncbi:MAG TPA: CHRD domain-containing protein [Vicinamibacterales bacterium]|nr:CHRD domain-containing protein [Vicinamibacterales bacterium]